MKTAPGVPTNVRVWKPKVSVPFGPGKLYSAMSTVPPGSTPVTYATWPNGCAIEGHTATAPGEALRSTLNDERRATFGQFQASIEPRTNQSMRWWLAASAQATYEVQLHAYIPQRSTKSAIPAPGQRALYG